MSYGGRITIRELAAAMGCKPDQVKAEAAELGMLVTPDRAGRSSLSVADARGLTTGEVRRLLEHNWAWERHQRDTTWWVEGRSRAIAEAARAVQARARSRGSGAASQAARAAAVEAGRQYEKRTPRPSFGAGVYSVNLEYTEEVQA
jgi:hypothetical protein